MNEQTEAAAAAFGAKATQAGATTSVVSWLLSSEFGILIGVLIGLAGFGMNWYYSHKRDRREQAEHKARMKELRGE
jgi:Na+/glutamate symporter